MTILLAGFIEGAFSEVSSNGISRRFIRNGFYLKKPNLDRTRLPCKARAGRFTGLFGFHVDHFPEENGQNQSPAANGFVDIRFYW
jgi:hypothetical protein